MDHAGCPPATNTSGARVVPAFRGGQARLALKAALASALKSGPVLAPKSAQAAARESGQLLALKRAPASRGPCHLSTGGTTRLTQPGADVELVGVFQRALNAQWLRRTPRPEAWQVTVPRIMVPLSTDLLVMSRKPL